MPSHRSSDTRLRNHQSASRPRYLDRSRYSDSGVERQGARSRIPAPIPRLIRRTAFRCAAGSMFSVSPRLICFGRRGGFDAAAPVRVVPPESLRPMERASRGFNQKSSACRSPRSTGRISEPRPRARFRPVQVGRCGMNLPIPLDDRWYRFECCRACSNRRLPSRQQLLDGPSRPALNKPRGSHRAAPDRASSHCERCPRVVEPAR